MAAETATRRLRQACLHGRLSRVAPVVYRSIVALELAGRRSYDLLSRAGRTRHGPPIEQQLTAIVKTFERPKMLARLVCSIRRMYPDLRIIVADDSRRPTLLDGVNTVVLPYDSGVSEGRNQALHRVETKYVLVLDDDFIFYGQTKLGPTLAALESHPGIDLVGGKVVYLPLLSSIDYREQPVYPTPAIATMPRGSRIAGLPVCDKVANFFVGRTDRVRAVGWDSSLKRLDHEDFFTRAKGVLTSVLNEELMCLHAGTPFDRAYMAKRRDTRGDLVRLRLKYFNVAGD